MKDIFANLYNKVASFFHQSEESTDTSAKDVACNRLKLVLMQDRTNLSPAIMDRMKHELIDLLSKYVELDKELLDLSFEQEDNQMALMLSIPVIRAKEESEIEELLKLEDEGVDEGAEEVVDEETSDDETTEEQNSEDDSESSEESKIDEETTTESDETVEEETETSEETQEETEDQSETEEVKEDKKPEPSKKKSSKG